MRSAQVWGFVDARGRYYKIKLDDGREEHVRCVKGLTAQQSICCLQDALEKHFGEPCGLTIMNELALI